MIRRMDPIRLFRAPTSWDQNEAKQVDDQNHQLKIVLQNGKQRSL